MDCQPDVIEQLAGFVMDVVDGRLPGVGIRHDMRQDDIQKAVHAQHEALVMSALDSIGPEQINVHTFGLGRTFDFGFGTSFPADSPIHVDTLRIHSNMEVKSLQKSLRLHTADKINGANVLLANTSASFFDEDENYRPIIWNEHTQTATKDETRARVDHRESRMQALLDGGYDPLVSERGVYHFEQHPLYSVLLCIHADIGPATIHKFTSMQPDIQRMAEVSGLNIHAQVI